MSSLVTEKKITRKQLKRKITTQMTHLRNTAIRIHRNRLPFNIRDKLGDKMLKTEFLNIGALNDALDQLGYKDEREQDEKDHEKQQLEHIAEMIETLELDWWKYNDDGEWDEKHGQAEDKIDDPENWSGGVVTWQDQIQAINDYHDMDTHGINGKVHFVVQGVLNGDFQTETELKNYQAACKAAAKEKRKAECKAIKDRQEAKKKAHAEHMKQAEAKDKKEAEGRGDIDMNSADWRKKLYNKKREEAQAKAKESSSDYYSDSEEEDELVLTWLNIPPDLQNLFGEKILVDAEGDPNNIYNENGEITGNITKIMIEKGGWKKNESTKNPGRYYFSKSDQKSLWATEKGKGVFPIKSLINGMKKPAAKKGGRKKTRRKKRRRTKKKRRKRRTKKKRKRKRRKTRK